MLLFLTPLLCAFAAQIIKVIQLTIRHGFDWSYFWQYGEFPSGHTAGIVGALTTVIIATGFSALSGVVLLLVLLLIKDATGLRNEIEMQNRSLKGFFKSLHWSSKTLPHDRVGHTVPEVLGGIAIGIILPLLIL